MRELMNDNEATSDQWLEGRGYHHNASIVHFSSLSPPDKLSGSFASHWLWAPRNTVTWAAIIGRVFPFLLHRRRPERNVWPRSRSSSVMNLGNHPTSFLHVIVFCASVLGSNKHEPSDSLKRIHALAGLQSLGRLHRLTKDVAHWERAFDLLAGQGTDEVQREGCGQRVGDDLRLIGVTKSCLARGMARSPTLSPSSKHALYPWSTPQLRAGQKKKKQKSGSSMRETRGLNRVVKESPRS